MGEINSGNYDKLAPELVDMAHARNEYFNAQEELNKYPADGGPSEEYYASFRRAAQTEWDSHVATRAQGKAYEEALEALASDETTVGDELIQKYLETVQRFSDNERFWLLEKMLALREKLVPDEVVFVNDRVFKIGRTSDDNSCVAKPQLVPVDDYRGRPYQRLVWCVPVEGSAESVVVDEQEIVIGRQDVKDTLGRYKHYAMNFVELINRAKDYDVVEGEREAYRYRREAVDRAINELKRVEPSVPGEMLAALESIGAIDMFVRRASERLTLGRAGTMSIIYSRVVRILAAYEKSKLDDYKGMNLAEIPIDIEEVMSLYRKLQK